jgi:hypothetical protein
MYELVLTLVSMWLQWAAGVFIFSLASIFLVLWMPATT